MQNNRFHSQLIVQESTENELPIKAAEFLSNQTQLSKQKVKLAMKNGAVWLTQGKKTKRLRRADKVLKTGEQVDIYYDETLLKSAPVEPCLLHDEGQYSVWFKPYGLLSQGSKWGDHHTINRYSEVHLTPQRPAFVVHRLDRAASGLILLAHTKQAAAKLSKLFQDRNIKKYYQVIVHGKFADETIVLDRAIDGKRSKSIVEKISYDELSNRSLLKVQIETGRKHQIRRHLAEYGFPVEGDRLHGKAKGLDKDLQLSAVLLSFTCPITQKLREYQLEQTLRPKF